jgi:hypothetical protein
MDPKYPAPPRLNARLKIHKSNNPIRPVVDNKNAPTYKIAKKTESHFETTPATGKPIQYPKLRKPGTQYFSTQNK